MITLVDLPTDIYNHISIFLSDKDLGRFLLTSRHIIVSDYLWLARQRAYWKRCGLKHIIKKGDLLGIEYLHLQGEPFPKETMSWAARTGSLQVVKFLHSLGVPSTMHAMDNAAVKGHLSVLKFLNSIGSSRSTAAINYACGNGHLDVVQFLHSLGDSSCTNQTMNWASANGQLDVVEFLHSVGVWTEDAIWIAGQYGHLHVVEFLKKFKTSKT